MDPITHTLTGLALSRAGLNRFTIHATPVLLLAANAPDADIVTAAGGTVAYLHYHRHLTHAFLLAPVMAILPVLIVRALARKPFDWKWAYLVSLAGVLSHPLLDWLNAYGIRFLLPFSPRWYRLDTTSLPDLWIWGALMLAALAPALSRLVSSEIGARNTRGRGWAWFALVFVAVYCLGRIVLHERALAVLDARLYDGATPTRVAAMPGPVNPFRWQGIVETEGFYSLVPVNLIGQFDPTAGQVLYKPQPDAREQAAGNAASRTPAFRAFLEFSAFPYWQFAPEGDNVRISVLDLRFGSPRHPRFRATALVDANGRVAESGFTYEPRR
jgi:inner membrane protein